MNIKELKRLSKNMVVEYYNRYICCNDDKININNVCIKKENKRRMEIILCIYNEPTIEFTVCCKDKINIESYITFNCEEDIYEC